MKQVRRRTMARAKFFARTLELLACAVVLLGAGPAWTGISERVGEVERDAERLRAVVAELQRLQRHVERGTVELDPDEVESLFADWAELTSAIDLRPRIVPRIENHSGYALVFRPDAHPVVHEDPQVLQAAPR